MTANRHEMHCDREIDRQISSSQILGRVVAGGGSGGQGRADTAYWWCQAGHSGHWPGSTLHLVLGISMMAVIKYLLLFKDLSIHTELSTAVAE